MRRKRARIEHLVSIYALCMYSFKVDIYEQIVYSHFIYIDMKILALN